MNVNRTTVSSRAAIGAISRTTNTTNRDTTFAAITTITTITTNSSNTTRNTGGTATFTALWYKDWRRSTSRHSLRDLTFMYQGLTIHVQLTLNKKER
jgi:hypothetical protein